MLNVILQLHINNNHLITFFMNSINLLALEKKLSKQNTGKKTRQKGTEKSDEREL